MLSGPEHAGAGATVWILGKDLRPTGPLCHYEAISPAPNAYLFVYLFICSCIYLFIGFLSFLFFGSRYSVHKELETNMK